MSKKNTEMLPTLLKRSKQIFIFQKIFNLPGISPEILEKGYKIINYIKRYF